MKRLIAWLHKRRVARARRRLVAALAVLDREMKAAGLSRAERRQLQRGIIADAKTFADWNDLEQVLR